MPGEPQNSEELILAFLAEGGDDYTSGEALSDKLGLSRTAVWKHVESLRAQGYRIEAAPSRGYRLVEVPDRLTSLELSPLLNTHDLGQVLHWYEELAFTNEFAMRLADEGAFHGEVVIAEAQTAGRGRRGRTWVSPARRNLYFSVILRPELPPGARRRAHPGRGRRAVRRAARGRRGGRHQVAQRRASSPDGRFARRSSPSSPPSRTGCTSWCSGSA